MMHYIFPFGPSVNTMYMQGKNHGQKFATKKLKDYKKAVKLLYPEEIPMENNLEVNIYLYPPDKRERDIDNYIKAILDGLTHIDAILDDSQIKIMHTYLFLPINKYNKGLVYISIDDTIFPNKHIQINPKVLETYMQSAPEDLFIKRSKAYDKRFGGVK